MLIDFISRFLTLSVNSSDEQSGGQTTKQTTTGSSKDITLGINPARSRLISHYVLRLTLVVRHGCSHEEGQTIGKQSVAQEPC